MASNSNRKVKFPLQQNEIRGRNSSAANPNDSCRSDLKFYLDKSIKRCTLRCTISAKGVVYNL